MKEQKDHFYRVVRFYPHGGHGTIEEVLGSDLTIEEAENLAETEAPATSDERLIIQDQDEIGLDSIVRIDHFTASNSDT